MNSKTLLLAVCGALACQGSSPAGRWAGTIDTLPSGIAIVSNPSQGIWQPGNEWRIVEEVRIGATEGTGPETFGDIQLLRIDPAGRFYVFESQAQELRVFDPSGAHLRTIGREGSGPGEFRMAIGMDWAPDGTLWVLDPRNNRFSIIDTSGTFLGSKPSIGGIMSIPWPGGFDDGGWLYHYAPRPSDNEIGRELVLVRYDTMLVPHDTIEMPQYAGEREFFLLQNENAYMRTPVPFSPDLEWRLTRTGEIWSALTGEYRLIQCDAGGDTSRIIVREFDPIPVADADIDSAIAGMEWFTRMGGKIDRSKFPGVKPALETFFVDDGGRVWVLPVTAPEDKDRVLDVFDAAGRYLGRVRLPFRLETYSPPIIRGNMMYAVILDELDVPYVIRARIETG
ncbi:MAG: hypothetical protein GTO22_17900 [Gemmatimonadales bacterium]|nr:hypothetical protein [Gemmatimonadales bacterium]